MSNIKFEDEKIQDIIEIVNNLNSEISEQTGFGEGISYRPVIFNCDGSGYLSCAVITFLGEQIWNSEDGERGFDDDKNEYEPLENYLREGITKIVNTINRIKL